MTTPGLWLIDSSIYIFRSYFALEPRWRSRDGLATEAVYGFASFLIRVLTAERPDFVAAAFDESLESGFRHRLDRGYKANRALPDEALAFQLDACRRVAEALGLATLASPEYEADDLIATLAARARGRFRVHILSGDKDLAQLLEGDTRLQDYGRGDSIDREAFIASSAIVPERVPDFLALVGDAADCIPGVPGVGPVTATALLSHLGPLERWLDHPQRAAEVPVRGARQLPAKLAAHRERIELSLALARLVDSAPVTLGAEDLRRRPVDREEVTALFKQLGIQGLLPRLRTLALAEA